MSLDYLAKIKVSKELMEGVAKHMFDFANFIEDPKVESGLPDWENVGSIRRENYRRIAREVIRQMEWARRLDPELKNDTEWYEPMTLAPDGWKP